MPDATAEPNQRLSRARQALTSPSGSGHQMSRQELAEAVNAYLWQHHGKRVAIDRSYISKLELGKHRWPNALYREAFRHVLHASSDAELGFHACRRRAAIRASAGLDHSMSAEAAGRSTAPEAGAGEASALPDGVRAAVLAAETDHHPTTPVNLEQLRADVSRVHESYQRAEYDHAAALLPALMAATAAATIGPRMDHKAVNAAAAAAHLAVAKLALKFGDAHLAWIAADRARARAADVEATALQTAAYHAIGCALIKMSGRLSDAATLIDHAIARTTRRHLHAAADISSLGALTLLTAVIAARRNDHRQAQAHLHSATGLAERLKHDRNDVWTAFGPTNVLIHKVNIASGIDPDRAIILGERLDVSHLHPVLLGRRSQVHIDLAPAFSQRPGGDPSAVLHLLQAEHVAPQMMRLHPPTRALIRCLLGRERRAATPGLRGLAARVGVTA